MADWTFRSFPINGVGRSRILESIRRKKLFSPKKDSISVVFDDAFNLLLVSVTRMTI